MSEVKVTTCDWCLQEALVQTIDEKLWRFWRVISHEGPLKPSLMEICEKCKSRYEEFSLFTERWKSNESIVEKALAPRKVRDEFSMDVKYHPIIKEEILEEEISNSDYNIAFVDEGKGGVGSVVLPDCMNAHGEPKTSFVCSFCHKYFSTSYRLKVHFRVHTGDKPYKCLQCNKAFAQSGNLISHQRQHTGEKPFRCLQCNKNFTSSSALKGHLHVHIGDKPFKCSFCVKAFAQSGHLISHLRIHTGEKPFKCFQCNKTFTQSGTLKGHLRTHTGDKPFKCLYCLKGFGRSSTLKRHLGVHTRDIR